jgi:hypothetical protein
LTLAGLDAHAAHLLNLLAATCRQRAEAAAALPLHRQDLAAVTVRLTGLDSIMVGELHATGRGAPFRELPYTNQPSWKASDGLYEQVWRHHAGDGRFV